MIEDKISIKIGDAVENLTDLTKIEVEKFDFAFIEYHRSLF
jgi:hypothetical protein